MVIEKASAHMKITSRIPRQKFAYIEIEVDIEEGKAEKFIERSIELIDKYSSTDVNEVILLDQTCPTCGKAVWESIGFSEKNNKPYHRIKCSNKDCDYIKWVNVGAK